MTESTDDEKCPSLPVAGPSDSTMEVDSNDIDAIVNGDHLNPASKTPPATTCHMLPCKIEYQGMANTHVYFCPTSMGDEDCYAATFRGRGLLAVANNIKNFEEGKTADQGDTMQGTVLSISEMDENHEVDIKATFDNVMEWRHEHNMDVVHFNAISGAEQPKTNRVAMALEWSKTAQALHAPLEAE